MEGDRSQTVSAPLPASTVPTWFDFDQTFQIPNPASTNPLDSTPFDLDFFDHPSLPTYADPFTLGEFASTRQTYPILISNYKAPPNNPAVPADDISALFDIPQLDLLQQTLPSFSSDWTQFLNFEPDLSPFPSSPSSPSLTSSLANTPPLIDDAALSPSSPSDSNSSSPGPLLDILPHLGEKGIQFPTAAEPMIRGQDFLLPPGEDAGILSVSALLSVH